MSERASQMCALVATIDPVKTTAGTTSTCDVIDASLYDSVLFIVSVGAVSSCSGGVTFKLYEGTATGTVTTLVGSTAWTAANTSSQNVQLIWDHDCERMTGPNHRYLKATLAPFTGNTGTYYSMVALGFKPRFHPASDGDLASIVTIATST